MGNTDQMYHQMLDFWMWLAVIEGKVDFIYLYVFIRSQSQREVAVHGENTRRAL